MKTLNRRHVAIFVAMLTTALAVADDKVSQIDQLLQQYHDLGQFSGSAMVVDAGSTVLSNGYGIANQEWQIANTPDTHFRVGSVTKSFTALAILQLEEQGKLDLDAAISVYLPWYRDDTGSRVSLRQLLTHTDGIPNYTGNVYFWQSYENGVPYSTAEFIARYCSGELEFDPGSQYRYGNAGYSILGAIIEKVSGMGYADTISRQILEPLNMESTGQHRESATLNRRATGYEVSIDGYRPASPAYKNLRAAGSMYSTVEDLSHYNKALFGGPVVSADSIATLFESREGSIEGTFAYGWNVGELTLDGAIASKRYMATNGEINGFNAALLRLPDDQHFVVLLNNTGETNLFDIASNIVRILYDLPATRPVPQLRDAFYAKLRDESVETAFSFYREQRKSQPDDFLFFPWPMRILAGQYIHDGRYDYAIDILRLNLETNPNDSRSLVLLAQAQLQIGAIAEAIVSLKAALSLDETNAFAADLLIRLEK
jgi:CubicO group peptidase (beta-lactamase class C family)